MIKKLFLTICVLIGTTVFATNYDASLIIGIPPSLENFTIHDGETSRVYFESSEIITGSNISGFTISGKTITGITINTGSTTGHYFSVSSPFTFWDNNTIRYEGGSNIKDLDGNNLEDFTLTYIFNKIEEPQANTYRYVTNSASGGGDGTSEANAWTFQQALSKASAGQTVWIKAGNYGNLNLSIKNKSGTISNPIKFIGYKNSIGDISSNYYDYNGKNNSNLKTSEMPTLTGTNVNSGNALWITSCKYIIFRNIQATKYLNGFRGDYKKDSESLIFDRINISLTGSEIVNGGTGIEFSALKTGGNGTSDFFGNKGMRVLNSVFLNISMIAVDLRGEGFNLVDNVKSYSDRYEVDPARNDYHIAVSGHNNIIRNCHAENFNNTHSNLSTHGIGVRGGSQWSNTYNLIELSTVINCYDGLYVRNLGSNYNVIKNSTVRNNGNTLDYRSGGLAIMSGCDNNIFENIDVYDTAWGIYFTNNQEDDHPTDVHAGNNNIIRNCNFYRNKRILFMHTTTSGTTADNNKILNCNFYDNKIFYAKATSTGQHVIVTNFEIANSNIINTSSIGSYISDLKFDNNNFFGNKFSTPSNATNSLNTDPMFENPDGGNFKLKLGSQIINAGKDLPDNKKDFDGFTRPAGENDIGAHEYEGVIVGSVVPDLSICNGENATLTASGGTSYQWSTGETAASINVSPTSTTTYTVTIGDGTGSDDHDVQVTVNELPTVALGADLDICYGESITLTATGSGDFLWNTGETSQSITVSPTVTSTYTVTASNSCATDASDSITVNVNPEISLNAGDDIIICLGDSATITATGNSDFLWSTGETTASITVNPTVTTTYTVISSSGNCSLSDDIIVSVDNLPTVDLGNDQDICFGESVTLTAEGSGDFIWSTGETSSSITVSPTSTSTYSVVATSSCDTTGVSDEIVINVNPEIILDAGTDLTICEGETATLTATGNGDFLWSTGETTSSITVNPTTTTTYTVSSTSGSCSISDDILVNVNLAPAVTLGSDLDLCFGETVTLTAQGVGDFLWSTGETTASISVSPTETTTYTVVASNSCSESVSDEIVVTVATEITLDAGADQIICLGDNAVLTAIGNADFLWSTGETTASITVNPAVTTTYSVTSTNGTCSVTDELIVTVDNPPLVSLGEDISICYGENVTIEAQGQGDFLWNTGETSASITVNPSITTTYSVVATSACDSAGVSDEIIVNVTPEIILNVGPDITICNGESTTLTASGNGPFVWSTGETTASITVSPSSTTTYSVSSDSGDCSKSDEVKVIVNTTASVNAGVDLTICEGETVNLTASGEGNFLWSTGETTATISVNPLITTTYSVTSSNSCGGGFNDEITVIVNEKPNVIANDDISIISGESITLTAVGEGNFLWNTGETTANITVSPAVTTTYVVTATSNEGCTNQDSVIVTVDDSSQNDGNSESVIIAEAGEDITICQGGIAELSATGGDSFLWSTGEITASITVSPAETTTYFVTVSDGKHIDVEDVDQVTVFVDNNCTIIGNRSIKEELKIFPNPTQGLLNIELTGYSEELSINLYSLRGRLIYSESLNNFSADKIVKRQINLSHFGKGVYIVRIDNKGNTDTKKVLVI